MRHVLRPKPSLQVGSCVGSLSSSSGHVWIGGYVLCLFEDVSLTHPFDLPQHTLSLDSYERRPQTPIPHVSASSSRCTGTTTVVRSRTLIEAFHLDTSLLVSSSVSDTSNFRIFYEIESALSDVDRSKFSWKSLEDFKYTKSRGHDKNFRHAWFLVFEFQQCVLGFSTLTPTLEHRYTCRI